MHDVKDISYYKGRAKQLPKKRFDEIVTKTRVKSEEYWIQLLTVASVLQHEDKVKLESQAKKLTFIPPKSANDYLFNDLNFVLWAMPQDNPIPQPIYNKMIKLKQAQRDNLPETEQDKLTPEESRQLLDSIIWKRGDENFGVKITGSVESGLPFGQDRLLLIWAITEAIKAGEPSVIGFCVKDFLDYFKIDASGRAYDEVEERCERLKETNVKVWWTTDKGKFQLECNYLDSVLIFRPKKDKSTKGNELEVKPRMNMITLHLGLWAHLAKENYVWLNPEVIKLLKDSPGALDLYQWACAYAFKNKIKTIPLRELFIHLGMKEDQLYKHKKSLIKKWIEKINAVVNDKEVVGIGSHFELELQEDQSKRGNDILILHPPFNQLVDLTKNKS